MIISEVNTTRYFELKVDQSELKEILSCLQRVNYNIYSSKCTMYNTLINQIEIALKG